MSRFDQGIYPVVTFTQNKNFGNAAKEKSGQPRTVFFSYNFLDYVFECFRANQKGDFDFDFDFEVRRANDA